MKLVADSNVVRVKDELARCANLTAMNLAGFFDAVDQFVEQLRLHLEHRGYAALDAVATSRDAREGALHNQSPALCAGYAPAHDVAAAEAAATKLVPRRHPLPLAKQRIEIRAPQQFAVDDHRLDLRGVMDVRERIGI